MSGAPGAHPGGELPAGVPAPCLTCGAPMTPRGADALHADPTLVCGFCGRSEPLPAGAAELHRHLRLRLLQLRRARDLAEAPLHTYQTVKQSWGFALVLFVALAAWRWWELLAGRHGGGAQVAVFAAISGAAAVGVVTGYLGMMRAFRRWVRPVLRARPPVEHGLAARCRSCGAPLPSVRAPSVTCQHCGASNFLDDALARDASALLAAERAEHQRRAHGGGPPGAELYLAPSRAFTRWGVTGAAIALAVGLAVALALG